MSVHSFMFSLSGKGRHFSFTSLSIYNNTLNLHAQNLHSPFPVLKWPAQDTCQPGSVPLPKPIMMCIADLHVKRTGFIDVNNLLMTSICSKGECAFSKLIAFYEHSLKNSIPELASVLKSVSQFHYFFQAMHRISAYDIDLLRLVKPTISIYLSISVQWGCIYGMKVKDPHIRSFSSWNGAVGSLYFPG
jgi:hypothetical protein